MASAARLEELKARFNAALDNSGLTNQTKKNLIGYLGCAVIGIDSGFSDRTVRKYQRLAADLGIDIDEFAEVLDSAPWIAPNPEQELGGQAPPVGT